jgi:hypothetical protein
MKFLQTACATVVALTTVTSAFAAINGVRISPREFNDIPLAMGSSSFCVGSPAWVGFTELNVSAPTGFANRDVWRFSADGGASAYQIPNQYFNASFDLTLTGTPISPRKEAGFLLQSANVGDIQFLVNTDGHEVVQFGGSSFYAFPSTFDSGETIHLGLSYTIDPVTHANALRLEANGVFSPYLDFGPGHGNGSTDLGNFTLGGYFQIVNDPNNPNNSGSALFNNIQITLVPEPSALALAGVGAFAAFLLRRRNQK